MNDQNSHSSADSSYVNLSSDWVDGDVNYFDAEVLTSLVKGSVGRCSNDPLHVVISTLPRRMKQRSTYISGSVIPLVANAQSRWVLHDMRMDSVPPEVVEPAPSGWLYLYKNSIQSKNVPSWGEGWNLHPEAHCHYFCLHFADSCMLMRHV